VTRRPAALLALVVTAGCASGQDRSGAPPPDVALGRPVTLAGEGEGDPAVVTDGRLVTEGAAPVGSAVSLADVRSAVSVDLGASRSLRALLVQAGAADIYFVETSEDGSSWRIVWRFAPLDSAAVQRTRTTVLPRPTPARWLRVRPTTARSAAVSEVEAFEAVPAAWPRLDTSAPGSHLPLWPTLTHEPIAELYQALSALLMLVVGWVVVARRAPGGLVEQRARRGALVLLAAVSLLAWPNLLNFHYYRFVHTWDTFHYYLGAKYFRELGYTRLYSCTAVVDAEDGIDLHGYVMRDLRDNREVPALRLVEEAPECRARFSAKRWETFRRDSRFFRTALGYESWAAAHNDHGFNGTPVWAVVGGLLTRLGPASWPLLTFLALLDLLMLLLAFLIIGRTFGLEAGCLTAGFWGLNTLSQWGWTGGGFLRCDYLLWLVVAIAALATRRPALAGFALAYSTLLRVYPVFAVAGLGLAAALDALSLRSIEPFWRHRRFAAGGALAVVLLMGSSILLTGRAGIWKEFLDNSEKHLGSESVNLLGLPVLLSYEHDARVDLMADPLLLDRHAAWKQHLADAARRTRAAHWAAVVAFGLLLAVAVRGAPDWVAAILGLGLMPIFMKASGYYYGMLLVDAALWPASPAAGFALASFTWLTNVIPALWPDSDTQFAGLSFAVVALVTGLAVAFAWKRRGGGTKTTGPNEQGR
jgi:hypothetical protein